uniref:SEFIR domain-containing protein n=1 Tax=Biomphalaria glabrata TaxID=6526 RepID=A0A2C9LV25_BIOGL
MGDHQVGEVKTGSSTTKHPQNDNTGPIIEETQESEEYQQDLQVVLGTAFGVIAVVGLIALGFLLYRIYKSRQAALSYPHNEILDTFERDPTVEIDGKSQPLVLLLYAYDCSIHQQVVMALAGFLMEACGITVSVDLMEEQEITDKGIDDWLVDRLQDADYIMVLCSLGARLRCSKKGVRFKPDCHQLLPDYFAVAVDYVAEKMRAEKQKGLSVNKFLTAYMDYSTRSDIPPQLETASQFCLMKDIHKLHMHFNTQGPDSAKADSVSQSSTCENHYHETETGAVLKAILEQAKAFFKENPSWMDDRLEPERCPSFFLRGKNRKRRRNSMEQPLLALTETPPLMHTTDKSFNNVDIGDNHPLKSEHVSQQDDQYTHDKERSVKVSNTLPRAQMFVRNENDQTLLYNSVVYQNRQNSLPSSLASSCLTVLPARHAMSKSMDSFAMDNSLHPDGLPCLFCNSAHMEARAECRLMGQYRHANRRHTSAGYLNENHLTSQINGTFLGPGRSQTTVLHAEVHQEWGQSNKGTPDKKSSTFAGDPRSWSSDLDFSGEVTPFLSLPPHYPPPSIHNVDGITEWKQGMQRWGSGHEVIGLQSLNNNSHHRECHRTLSDSSVSTDDSCSMSDGDSLERDIRSIHNISSFRDFISPSSITNSACLCQLAPNHSPLCSVLANGISKPILSKTSSTLFARSYC